MVIHPRLCRVRRLRIGASRRIVGFSRGPQRVDFCDDGRSLLANRCKAIEERCEPFLVSRDFRPNSHAPVFTASAHRATCAGKEIRANTTDHEDGREKPHSVPGPPRAPRRPRILLIFLKQSSPRLGCQSDRTCGTESSEATYLYRFSWL